MLVIKGQYATARVMLDEIEKNTEEQIRRFLNCPVFKGCQIRIMPDTHAGAGAVIGFTSTFNDYVIPNVIGVDICCGIVSYNLGKIDVDFVQLDNFIRGNIPSGMAVNSDADKIKTSLLECFNGNYSLLDTFYLDIQNLCCKLKQSLESHENYLLYKKFYERVILSLGSCGGGNHFLELDKDPNDNIWLTIHTGSRNLGKVTAEYHQGKAKGLLSKFFVDEKLYKDLEFLPIDLGGRDYLYDMKTVQKYALLNREIIARRIICDYFGRTSDEFKNLEVIDTMHNYINFDDNIIRKGAISAKNGERVLIPINMRDGVIVGTGKGNSDWNCSAPHGAGRVLSRNAANETLSVESYKETMQNVWTSCVNESTLDESPFAYKTIELILNSIGETVNVDFVMKPIYNFKASEQK